MIKREEADAGAESLILKDLADFEEKIDTAIKERWYGIETELTFAFPLRVPWERVKALTDRYGKEGGYTLQYGSVTPINALSDTYGVTLSHPKSDKNRERKIQELEKKGYR